VSQGWVTLRGEWNTISRGGEAERAVGRLAGVKRREQSDRGQAAGVAQRLEAEHREGADPQPETDAQHITVEVQGSKVILRGTVSASYLRNRRAEDTPGRAWCQWGV